MAGGKGLGSQGSKLGDLSRVDDRREEKLVADESANDLIDNDLVDDRINKK